ncbi:MAG: MBL fold metallo-hydrolase [Chloroflexi bacterium]|nr:MBL fold metallo-hydrolase [Chloroflexota bacterium]
MKIKFLGTHNAESKDTNLACLLLDDILAVDAGSLASALTFAEQEKVEAILLSHGHYDHIRELPAFAFNNSSRVTKVFGLRDALQIFSSHLADGLIYPEFVNENSYLSKSILELCEIHPLQAFEICGYRVLPVRVPHPIPAVGFEIANGDKHIFYTGDTGPGLADIWQHISPQLIIADMTLPDRLSDVAQESGHLCARMLKAELIDFQRIKGYLPRVTLVHMSPQYESEIAQDVEKICSELSVSISLMGEGEELIV